jgi:hypothetical protein
MLGKLEQSETLTQSFQTRRCQIWPNSFLVPLALPFRTQHPLGAVVNRPSVWSDR